MAGRILLALLLLGAVSRSGSPDARVPRYAHIFVIMEENKAYGEIIGSPDAPTITKLAREYGTAANFYGEVHPSEGNYVALVGGSTFGIHDDASFLRNSVDAPSLASQLDAEHLGWKGYYEDLPSPGSLAPYSGLYAGKHSGFLNFKSVRDDPHRAEHIVGFDQLGRDLRANALPAFGLIVPNLCNEMHGVGYFSSGSDDCKPWHKGRLIWRGDQNVKQITGAIMASKAWKSSANCAIVVTFDEDDTGGSDAGGHIPTIVVTNHGPRRVVDSSLANHYSLLRTIEDAFGIHNYLQHAAQASPLMSLFTPR
ncbi:MAG: alkaline phosphatase family protein [Candidatus Eremiobacteraeota bacterium]|nr:alkaline phosphatase family protein [Candidatus Eremiobacteraeota bacterium]